MAAKVIVEVCAVTPSVKVMVVVESVQVALTGTLVQATVTVPSNPPSGVTVKVRVPVDPAVTVNAVGAVNSKFHPVPDKATTWGLSLSLLTMVIDPTRVPVVVGAKLTLNVQFAPAATLLPHVLVSV